MKGLVLYAGVVVAVCHMYAATTASAPDYGASTAPINKGDARGG